jgi:hypothetical protein
MFEWIKLGASVLTPILVFALGVIVARAARTVEDAQWAGRKLVERRLALHEEMAPLLNDLLCFFACKGHFREIEPPAALAAKRKLDKTFFTNEQLFGADFRKAYREFIDATFRHWTGAGSDAKLRASATRLKHERGRRARKWDPDWDRLFVPDTDAQRSSVVAEAYDRLMERFADEVGVFEAASTRKPTRRSVIGAHSGVPRTT